jgi:D-arabinose 1-dehydrogenase-like Zn-dependent alcohol dehydrogenase
MRAVLASRPGPAEVLLPADVPEPEPGSGQARIRVEACGVCFHDVLNRRGVFPRTRFPAVLGHEIAGVVEAVAPDVDPALLGCRVAVLQSQPCGSCDSCGRGDEVLCRSGGGYVGEETPGGYAEQAVVRASALVAVPDGVEPASAAVTACAMGTSWQALTRVLDVEAGQSLVVPGAGGGVGLHAVGLARRLGLHVVAVTTSPTKVAAIRSYGADDVVVAEDGAFAGRIKDLTGGGADFVLDPVGQPTLVEAMHALRPGGRYVLVGNVTARDLTVPAGLLLLKGLRLLSSVGVTAAGLSEVLQFVAEGAMSPAISDVVPLAEAARCHALLEQGQVTGRLVLSPMVAA